MGFIASNWVSQFKIKISESKWKCRIIKPPGINNKVGLLFYPKLSWYFTMSHQLIYRPSLTSVQLCSSTYNSAPGYTSSTKLFYFIFFFCQRTTFDPEWQCKHVVNSPLSLLGTHFVALKELKHVICISL